MTITAYPSETEWMEQAACIDADASLFFEQATALARPKTAADRAAIAICNTCPVVEQCLKAALDRNEQYGVWGGQTPTERMAPRREAYRARVKKPAPPKQAAELICPSCSGPKDRQAAMCRTCRFATPAPIKHGTSGGYQQHRSRGEDACDPCKIALRKYQRGYKAKSKSNTKKATA